MKEKGGLKLNRLVREEVNENGKIVYKMATFDIDVVAKSTGGLAPTITYLHNEQDVSGSIVHDYHLHECGNPTS